MLASASASPSASASASAGGRDVGGPDVASASAPLLTCRRHADVC